MGIENAIANFGLQIGQNTQRTVENALARREEQRRYEDKRNILAQAREDEMQQRQAQQEALNQKAAEAKEMEFSKGWANAYYSAPDEATKQQVYQGGAAKAIENGYLSPEQVQGLSSDEFMGRIAGQFGHEFAGGIRDSKYGLNPVLVQDKQGNVSAYQLNSQGGASRVDFGGGTPIKPLKQIDYGSRVDMVNPHTGVPITSRPKGIPPQSTPQHAGNVVSAQEQAKQAAEETKNASNSSKMLRETESSFKSLAAADLDLIYGRGESFIPEVLRSQAGIDLVAQRDQYLANLRLAQVGKLAGTGPITESEQAILKQAATVLNNQNISPELARRALIESRQIIMNAAKRNAGRKGGNADPLGLGL